MLALGIAVITGILIFAFLYLFVILRIAPKTQVQQRLRRLKYDTRTEAEERSLNLADIPFMERTFLPMCKWVEQRLLRFAPEGIHEQLERRIMLAGKQHVWSANAFVAIWMLSSVFFFLLMFLMITQLHMAFIQNAMLLVVGLLMGGVLPIFFLDSLISKRQKLLRRQLPEVLDLLCVSVQAGLSFDGSMKKIVDRMNGPLVDECDRMLRDVRMGMTRRTALLNLSRRCGIQEIQLFVTAVIQAEQLGTSMSTTMEAQADNMRERRRQSVKAEAMRAPIKIIFPLVLFIFPALFVVLLLPVVLMVLKGLNL